MINYLIEVSICLMVFYICYWLSLSRLKLLNLNRGYLLITLALSLTIPLLDISLLQTEMSITSEISDYISSSASVRSNEIFTKEIVNPILLTWLIGMGVVAVAFLLRVIRLIGLISKHPKEKTGRLWYVSVPDEQPVSSFFHYVLVPKSLDPESEEAQIILKHEQKHAHDLHSLDLILTALSGMILWFNPVIYLYRKSLKLQHEYIADEAVLSSYEKGSYTDLLVRYSLKQSGFSLAHSFSEHPVEKRLKMIENINPTTMKKLRLLWSLPVIFSLTLLLGINHETYSQTTSTQSTVKEATLKGSVRDGQSGEGLDKVTIFFLRSRNKSLKNADGFYQGTFTNSDGNYRLMASKSDTLIVFRKEGYESIIVPYRDQDVVNVNLTKKPVPKKKKG